MASSDLPDRPLDPKLAQVMAEAMSADAQAEVLSSFSPRIAGDGYSLAPQPFGAVSPSVNNTPSALANGGAGTGSASSGSLGSGLGSSLGSSIGSLGSGINAGQALDTALDVVGAATGVAAAIFGALPSGGGSGSSFSAPAVPSGGRTSSTPAARPSSQSGISGLETLRK